MNIFEQYGIKEVADVCLYAIELDENDDEVYVPVLYLDTLKISTVEETAEQTSARGGLGNPELIIWDYGKEITVTLEDALYTPASQSMTWGGKYDIKKLCLYGTYEDYERGLINNARFEIENYKDFNYSKADNCYSWMNIEGNVIDDDGNRFKVNKNVSLFCDLDGKNWRFGLRGPETLFFNCGIFKLSQDRNNEIIPIETGIYQIDHALNNVIFLDRIEKCIANQTFVINTVTNTQHGNYRYLEKYSQCELTVFIDPKTMLPYEPNTTKFTKKNGEVIEGELRTIKQHEIYYKWTRSKAIDNTSLGHQIIIDAQHFPGTYRLVGETYSRSRKTGKDQRFQFEIPLCKMSTENNFTLEAEGEPTTFNMNLKVLRREDGVMMKLTQYSVEKTQYDGFESNSTSVISQSKIAD